MEALVAYLALTVPTFIMVVSRAIGLFMQAPVLSNRNLPAPVRMSLIAGISLVAMTQMPATAALPQQLLGFVIVAMTELALGFILGYSANIMFLAIQSAGELGGVQAGLSSASVQNPFTKTNVNAMGTFYFNIAILIFMVFGGHLWLIGGFVQSFALVPIGSFVLSPAVGAQVILASGAFLAITIQLALPMVTVVFVAELGVGYMSKVAQQASSLTQDLVTIAKPVSGLILLLLLLPNLMSMTHQYAEQNMKDMHRFLQVAGENSKR